MVIGTRHFGVDAIGAAHRDDQLAALGDEVACIGQHIGEGGIERAAAARDAKGQGGAFQASVFLGSRQGAWAPALKVGSDLGRLTKAGGTQGGGKGGCEGQGFQAGSARGRARALGGGGARTGLRRVGHAGSSVGQTLARFSSDKAAPLRGRGPYGPGVCAGCRVGDAALDRAGFVLRGLLQAQRWAEY